MRARRPPAERVRARLAAQAGDARAAEMPSGYQRLGRVLALRLPESLRPYYELLGRAWQEELGVATVLVRSGPIEGELRTPGLERIAGEATETEVVEHGVRWRFDAARIMFAAGNRTERRRAGRLVQPGERVLDLFAGIGYFAIPAAVEGGATQVVAVDKNPVAVGYLRTNAALNGVADRVLPLLGDNRAVELPGPPADRVFLGYLPSALPWIPRALSAVRADGWLHVHAVEDARGAKAVAADRVRAAVVAAGGRVVAEPSAREVKPYGPGRTHVVVDVAVRPATP
jgi:tRNA wybutosine-synthesizing protein 2